MWMSVLLILTFVSMEVVLIWSGVIDVNVIWDFFLFWMERIVEVSLWNLLLIFFEIKEI